MITTQKPNEAFVVAAARKFPSLNLEWPPEQQSMWWECYHSLWDLLNAVIVPPETEAIKRDIETVLECLMQNDALSEPRGGEGAPNQPQTANRPDGSLQ